MKLKTPEFPRPADAQHRLNVEPVTPVHPARKSGALYRPVGWCLTIDQATSNH